jgi:hypothetical protein
MYFCAAASSENDHGEHELGLEHGPGAFDHPIHVARQEPEPDHRMLDAPLDSRDETGRYCARTTAGASVATPSLDDQVVVPSLSLPVAR